MTSSRALASERAPFTLVDPLPTLASLGSSQQGLLFVFSLPLLLEVVSASKTLPMGHVKQPSVQGYTQ